MILNIFSSRPNHPLGDDKELKRVLAELPHDSPKAVDEIFGWFESLRLADDFRLDHFFDVVSRLDEAAQQHLRRLSRDYLQPSKLSKNEERRLWSLCYNYWGEAAGLYACCLDRYRQSPGDKGSEVFKASLPLAGARLLAARSAQLKWIEFRYGTVGEDMWCGLGRPYMVAEAGGYAQKPVQMYPGAIGMTSMAQQYLQALVRASSSMDALLPLEIEVADRLISHFLPGFQFSSECLPGSVYWVDANTGMPPTRLARPPAQQSASLRFFLPGTVPLALADLIHIVERGSLPSELNLGGEYPASLVLKVLQHLAFYWSPVPPQRGHVRHAVKTRIAVLQGFDHCLSVFAGEVARIATERGAESWLVENVSLGGFCAVTGAVNESLKIATLLCIQPEGGDNWVLGVVRRCQLTAEGGASIGIQTLSRKALGVELRPRASGLFASEAIPAIWLCDENSDGEWRLVLPRGSFDVRQAVEFVTGGRRYQLAPVELEETGADFEVGRYREQAVA